MHDYDYIITGAGCAGLSLVMHLIDSGKFSDKRILLIDKDEKKANDRTWCFWEEEPGLFEPVVFRKWNKLWFHGERFSKQLDIRPYSYKMIRGADFYDYCRREIEKYPRISFAREEVKGIYPFADRAIVKTEEATYTAAYVFNSIPGEKPAPSVKTYCLLQHFKGWVIRCAPGSFDQDSATLMDFRIPQNHGTAFCYVLPFSHQEALVEYTLFSPSLLASEAYETGLKNYIGEILKIDAFEILEQEFGVIPMTNFKFDKGKDRLFMLGTAGGQTKASTGYTFKFIQKHSKLLAEYLAGPPAPLPAMNSSRFNWYDSILLQILQKNSLPGKDIFTDLFKKNPPQRVFKFLDNDTSIHEELKLIATLPTLPFLKAALHQVF